MVTGRISDMFNIDPLINNNLVSNNHTLIASHHKAHLLSLSSIRKLSKTHSESFMDSF